MRPELDEIKLLEAFLRGNLQEEQELELEIQLLWDQELQQKVMLQQVSYQAIQEAGRQQLRQELQAIHHRLFG
ncbi:hypothetical protein ACMA1I_16790 [Pontibacter sp. 13R65]|uniref:hypothetical protein n=1 Tax=Pontibacter sp. 13R65 TaxID=3127458 RepID=UPI00301D0330